LSVSILPAPSGLLKAETITAPSTCVHPASYPSPVIHSPSLLQFRAGHTMQLSPMGTPKRAWKALSLKEGTSSEPDTSAKETLDLKALILLTLLLQPLTLRLTVSLVLVSIGIYVVNRK